MSSSIKNNEIFLPPEFLEIRDIFLEKGFLFYLVGGGVRDQLLGQFRPDRKKDISDFDAATDAAPEEILSFYKRVIPVGIQFGTLLLLRGTMKFQVTTFRSDGVYADRRRPESVCFGRSLEEDLERRDFTVNGLAYDSIQKKIFDYHGGIEDLKGSLIRTIGNPEERFAEDALRILRACRFSAQLGFSVEEETFRAMRKHRENLRAIAQERILDEWVKIFESSFFERGMRILMTGRLLPCLSDFFKKDVPEEKIQSLLRECERVGDHHRGDNRLCLRLVCFLGESGWGLTGKEAEFFLRDFKFSNEIRHKVLTILSYESKNFRDPGLSAGIKRQWISAIGPELFAVVLSGKKIREERESFKEWDCLLREKETPWQIKNLAVNGKDLQKKGLRPGPRLGQLLNRLHLWVLDDPNRNKKELLEVRALRMFQDSSSEEERER